MSTLVKKNFVKLGFVKTLIKCISNFCCCVYCEKGIFGYVMQVFWLLFNFVAVVTVCKSFKIERRPNVYLQLLLGGEKQWGFHWQLLHLIDHPYKVPQHFKNTVDKKTLNRNDMLKFMLHFTYVKFMDEQHVSVFSRCQWGTFALVDALYDSLMYRIFYFSNFSKYMF